LEILFSSGRHLSHKCGGNKLSVKELNVSWLISFGKDAPAPILQNAEERKEKMRTDLQNAELFLSVICGHLSPFPLNKEVVQANFKLN
jgi:hypothetical protein